MSARNSKKHSETNWSEVDALKDGEIDTSDIPPLGDAFFARAKLRKPSERVEVTVRLDPEIAAWYRNLGSDQESRMAAALRLYAEAHQAEAPSA